MPETMRNLYTEKTPRGGAAGLVIYMPQKIRLSRKKYGKAAVKRAYAGGRNGKRALSPIHRRFIFLNPNEHFEKLVNKPSGHGKTVDSACGAAYNDKTIIK